MTTTPRVTWLALAALVLLPLGNSTAWAAVAAKDGPTSTLRSYNERLDKLLRQKNDAAVDKEAVRALAAELFDYGELARRALAQHWAKLNRSQQDEFVKTFSEMIEKNYVKQLRSSIDYEVQYRNEAIADTEATVATVVKVQTRGKSTNVAIDYKLRRLGERWRVYDLVTDEVSMLRNYRTQFNKIITTESYNALLEKMRKRITQSDSK